MRRRINHQCIIDRAGGCPEAQHKAEIAAAEGVSHAVGLAEAEGRAVVD